MMPLHDYRPVRAVAKDIDKMVREAWGLITGPV